MNRGYRPEDFDAEQIDLGIAGVIVGGIIGLAIGLFASPYVLAVLS